MLIAASGKLQLECDVLSLYETTSDASGAALTPHVRLRVFAGSKSRYALAVARALRFENYDHVIVGHVNLLVMLVMAMKVRPFSGPRAWLVGHGVEVWSGIAGLRRIAIRRMCGILSVSRYTQQRIQEQVPELPVDRFVLFPLALSDAWTAERIKQTKSTMNSDLPERFLLSVTRLDSTERDKGLLTVFESLAMSDDAEMKYLIAGTGDDQGFLLCAARRFGVAERVRFLGAVTDVQLAELYRRCCAFVLPSGKEGFGLVFLEAMFFGAPVIAAAEKGALDVVRNEETGLLISFGDVVGLIEAINRLATDWDLRNRLSVRARAMVVENGVFTFGAFVARFAAVLRVSTRDSGGIESESS